MSEEKVIAKEKETKVKDWGLEVVTKSGKEGLEITSLEDFVKVCIDDENNASAFRGQPNTKDPLLSALGRRWKKYRKTEAGWEEFRQDEKDALLFFKRHAFPHVEVGVLDDMDFLVLAQHHGVPTRLLDWTFNPLVGLFFAVNKDFRNDGIVFSIDPTGTYLDELEKQLTDPFDVPGLRTYIPTAVTKRITAQEGLFTTQTDPRIAIDLDVEDLIVRNFIIPKKYKKPIINSLFRIGVHNMSLFPDLDGVGSWVRQTQFGEY